MKLLTMSKLYLLGTILICAFLGASFYLQTHSGLNPCPLCILQRMTMAALGLTFFLGAIFNRRFVIRILFIAVTSLLALLGSLLAARQVWLQHLPNPSSDCGANLEYMLKVLPIKQVLQKIFQGSTECSQIDWRFLHLSLAEWSALCFILLTVLAIAPLFRSRIS
jgi:protein dithiol:quinone oxidoreductase